MAGASTGLNEPSYPNSEPSYPNNDSSYPNSKVEITDDTFLISLATPARLKKRLPNDELRAIILQLCEHDFLSLAKISDLIARTTQTTQNHLTTLVKEEKLAKKYTQDTHPSQAYTSTRKCCFWRSNHYSSFAENFNKYNTEPFSVNHGLVQPNNPVWVTVCHDVQHNRPFMN